MLIGRRFFSLIFVLAACGAPVMAAESGVVPAPAFRLGDSWVFDQTVERGQANFNQERLDLDVERVSEDTMMVGIKRDGAPSAFEGHLIGLDWSQRHFVDGQQSVTTRPFTFPMKVGASWTIDYVDSERRGAQISNHVHQTYKAVGWEEITVPAGKFRAIKVEAKGVDRVMFELPSAVVGGVTAAPNGATAITRTQHGGQRAVIRDTYAEFYYVPEIKNYVKSVEEQYTPDGVRVSRNSRVLFSYKLAS